MHELTLSPQQVEAAVKTRCPILLCRAPIGAVCNGETICHRERYDRSIVKSRMRVIDCELAA